MLLGSFPRVARLWSAIIRAAGTPCPTPANAGRLWHDERVLQLARAIVGILSDILRLGVAFWRSSSAIRVENLVLRRQLARYVERGIKPRRVDHVTREPRTVHQTLRMARCGGQCSSGDHRSLAPIGLADLLAPEVQGGPTTDSARASQAYSQDGYRKPCMGRGENCQ